MISRVVEAIDKQPRLIDLALHFPPASRYLTDMLVVRADGFVDPCIPPVATKPPAGPGGCTRSSMTGTG